MYPMRQGGRHQRGNFTKTLSGTVTAWQDLLVVELNPVVFRLMFSIVNNLI